MTPEADSSRIDTRWMALDVGSKTIGVAVTDPMKITARPLVTLNRRGLLRDCRAIAELADTHSVDKLIVGRPLRLDGSPSEIQSTIEKFVVEIERRLQLTVEWADERLSTKEAETLMAELGIPPRERKSRRNEFAAAIILRRYLEEAR